MSSEFAIPLLFVGKACVENLAINITSLGLHLPKFRLVKKMDLKKLPGDKLLPD